MTSITPWRCKSCQAGNHKDCIDESDDAFAYTKLCTCPNGYHAKMNSTSRSIFDRFSVSPSEDISLRGRIGATGVSTVQESSNGEGTEPAALDDVHRGVCLSKHHSSAAEPVGQQQPGSAASDENRIRIQTVVS